MKKLALGAALSGTAIAFSLTSAMAADPIQPVPFVQSAPAPSYVPVADPYPNVWTGFYAGAHVGGALPDDDDGSEVWMGGVQAGYNQQLGNFVLGGELSASVLDSFHYELGGGASLSQDWQVNALARAGFAFDNTLVYGTAGIAFAELNPEGTITSGSDTHTGLAFGGGVEHQIGNGLGAKLEYTQSRFHDVEYTTASGSASQDLVNHAVKAGLNFHF